MAAGDYSYINAKDMPEETLASIDGTENIVAFDLSSGKKVSFSVIADYILQKKTQQIGGSTQTVKQALDGITATDDGNGNITINI